MDVESFSDGILAVIATPEGGVATVGSAIAFIAESEADMDAAKAKAGGGGAAPAPAPAPAAAPPPPPAPAAAAAPAAPAPAAAPAAVAAPPPPPPPTPVAAPRADGRIIATPYAKKLAKEMGVDLSTIGGSGPNGRITAADVEAAKGGRAAPALAAAAAPSSAPAPPAPAASSPPAKIPATSVSDLRGTTVPFTSLQQAVSRNMLESLKVPEFRVSMTIRTDALDALYKKLKPKGVTMTALLAKACGVALVSHPILYASTTPDGMGCTYNEHINIAMAVAMPDGGLITPVLKDADNVDLYTMSRNWADLVKRARAKQLSPDEFTTGTFTISNLGMFGVDSFDAILPPGTAAILAVGGSKPVVAAGVDGRMGVEKQMVVNITCDHRVVYGAHAAEFLQTLKEVIEKPDALVF